MQQENHPFTYEGLGKVILAFLASGFLAHYCVQILMLPLGGSPRFGDTFSLMLNGGFVVVVLFIGWLSRRVLLVAFVFAMIGLALVLWFMSNLRGTALQWVMQVVLYVGLPLVGAGTFLAISSMAEVPQRPKKLRPNTLS
jgi:hypothetical protein